MKEKIKRALLSRLHAVEVQKFDVAQAVATRGVAGLCGLRFEGLKADVLAFAESCKTKGFAYKYATSRSAPCLYASVYAVMLEGLLGVLSRRSEAERRAWGDYLNGFQKPEDGLYYDPLLAGDAFEHRGPWHEGWGKHHLLGHMIIALARLGVTPRYPFKFLEWAYDEAALVKWMDRFDFAGDVWTVSNYFMNLYTSLEYARDYLNELRAGEAIQVMVDWLLRHQNSATGMWHTRDWASLDRLDQFGVIRAAYHFYPLFAYESIPVPHAEKVVERLLPLQNSWGGWTVEGGNAGACEDIDAIDPLIRFAASCPDRRREMETAVKRSLAWQFACRNEDRGFSFYCRGRQEYGGHPLTTSMRGESSLFATWFRTLCLAYEMRFLGMENDFDIGRFPGYEIG